MATSMAQFYAGRTLFLTGGSGFLGKQMIEKLLRSCPAIDQIYVLIRTKKGKSPDERIDQLFQSPIFDRVKAEQPNYRKKIRAIPGDILQPGLGICDSDESRILSNASVFIHSAASINFAEPLRNAVQSNILPTRKMLQLAKESKNVDAFIHVSTAYSQVDKKNMDEVVYEPPMDPYKLFELLDTLTDAEIATLTPGLLGKRPNTYTFTKAVAEKLVDMEKGEVPVAIVRPSIVTCSHTEPVEGWVDNYTAASGIYVGAGMGMLRHMNGDKRNAIDFVPVDMTSNIILITAKHIAENRNSRPTTDKNSTFVLNCATSTINPVTIDRVCKYISRFSSKYPTPKSVAFLKPKITIDGNWPMRNFNVHVSLPVKARLLDLVAQATEKKPRAVVIQEKFTQLQKVLEFFTTNQFVYETKNVEMIRNELTPRDKEEFNIDFRTIDWESYHRIYWFGLRKYLLKETVETDAKTQETATSPTPRSAAV